MPFATAGEARGKAHEKVRQRLALKVVLAMLLKAYHGPLVTAYTFVMVQRRPSELAAILRTALQEVQESVWRDSPAIKEMKRAILRAIADLQTEGNGQLRPQEFSNREGARKSNDT